MKKSLSALFISLFFCTISVAQPANDDCSNATDLGTLPTPGACVSGMQTGAQITLTNQTNVNATMANPYMYIASTCSGGGNLDNTGLDVWYKCIATGNILQINISSFPGCNIALFEGTSCSGLIGKSCSANGLGSLSIYDAVAGHTYYFKVTGDTTSVDNNFSVSVNNNIDCNNCIREGTITATAMPNNGTYLAGETVNFCFHVDKYAQINTSWLHGVQINFGNGWDQSTLVPNPPPTYMAASGNWVWTNSCTSTATSQTFGQGFYFEGGGSALNQGDNFGDGNSTSTSVMIIPANQWNFCWSLKVDSLNPTQNDLSITINTSGDGESGSWSDPGCAGDSSFVFLATKAYSIDTCLGLSVSITPSDTVLCYGDSLYLWANITGGTPMYSYTWSTITTTPYLNALITEDTSFVVEIYDNNGCYATDTVNIFVPDNYIIGSVSDGTVTMITGNVILLDANTPGSMSDTVAIAPMDFMGNYLFMNPPAGDYLLMYEPTDTSILHTYHTNAIQWQDADILSHSCLMIDTANILVTPSLYVNSGTAYFSGYVLEGVGFGNRLINNETNTVPGAPIDNVRMLLIDSVSGMGLDETFTDSVGFFQFVNVPVGIYEVVPDITGLYADSSYIINVTSIMQMQSGNNSTLNEVYTNLDFYADSNSVYIIPSSVGMNDASNSSDEIKLFPNPAASEITLIAESTITKISVVDVLGRTLISIAPNDKSVKLDLKGLQQGNYFVVIENNESIVTKKLVKE